MPSIATLSPAAPADHPGSPAGRLLDDLVGEAVAAGFEVAVVRPPGRDGTGRLEADVLVAPRDRAAFERMLVTRGLRQRPGWGRRPHRFYVTPVVDPDGGLPIDWLKVDTVSDLAFGSLHELQTASGSRCLAARCQADRAAARLMPADELAALFIHAILDNGAIRGRDRDRLAELAALVDEPGPAVRPTLTGPLGEHWWTGVVSAARRGDDAHLLAQAGPVRRALIDGRRGEVVWRRCRATTVRHCTKALTALRDRGPLVAFIGPDGTGKTTLTTALVDQAGLPARCFYGGTYPSSTPASTVPGLTTARVVVRLLSTGIQVQWHRLRGRLVILDRHPLQARPTANDTHLGARARMRRRVIAATLPRPDLLVVLDAPATVLHQRRPEHSVEQLDRDRQRHRALVGRAIGSPSLQADRPADSVLGEAIALIWSRALPDQSPGRQVGS